MQITTKEGVIIKTKIKLLLAAAAAVTICTCATGCGEKVINLNNYLEPSFSGYDSVGTASCSIDFETLVTDNSEAFGLTDDPSRLTRPLTSATVT